MLRVAVIDLDHCQPTKCGTPCITFCPPVRNKIEAIKMGENGFPIINEELCIGCGICVAKCPFEAIAIVNLPSELGGDLIHQYGVNSFRLYRLPYAEPGTVTGLLGRNGIGKSTALSILAGQLKPNLGKLEDGQGWEEVAKRFRGTLIQDYFKRMSAGMLRVTYKPQNITQIPRAVKGRVREILTRIAGSKPINDVVERLELEHLLDREVSALSGGELQRLAIAAAILRGGDCYIFDEPSSFLDVRQRVRAASAIRSLVGEGARVFVADHDLSFLDYVSDTIFIFYGEPGVYGIVSGPYSLSEGVNTYLEGYAPLENVRFRRYEIAFSSHSPPAPDSAGGPSIYWYRMAKTYGSFRLVVEEGSAKMGEVVGIVGPNGIGKSTFIKLLAGLESDDSGNRIEYRSLSYKPQHPEPRDETVADALRRAAGKDFDTELYRSELLRPLGLDRLLDRNMMDLSGGELQRVAIAETLSKEAAIYLLDEPSAFLDVEERYVVARLLKRLAREKGAYIFLVEHDLMLVDFSATRLMVFTGKPGIEGRALPPMSMREGFNRFLSELGITFRRDKKSNRPRVNKPDSRLDRAQKEMGEYYYVEAG
ncbi:Putative HMP/thiamine import ATP-binding protein YkoD [Candidatus Calditenuaceae archaeon HR02]|nr:Putative HMP/thiamine import ATP-binding protein YkoD [Candidatus Calditenuaceae archaeon HR02]